ncbi:MAG: serine/threonine-protein kinase [bacterium]
MPGDELNRIHFAIPDRVGCLHCRATIDVAGRQPFDAILCPECGKTFPLAVPFGNYILLEQIAEGGMGAVYMGFDPALKRSVAIKVLLKRFGDDPEFVRQFEREAQTLAALNNPNVVQVYTAGRENGQPYIVMELVDRGGFDVMITNEHPLEEALVLRTALDVIRGLRAAAAIGLAHGDVKPENILFDKEGHAKVVDFGLAQLKGEEWTPSVVWGTPFFISPEVAHGKRPTPQSDIYSLGCTLYYALAGKMPFNKPMIEDTVVARFTEKPIPLLEHRPDLHPETVTALDRMMEVDIQRRYPNYDSLMQDMVVALKAIERDQVAAPEAKKKPASHATWWIASSSATAVLAVVLWVFSGGKKEAPRNAQRPPPTPATVTSSSTRSHAPSTAPAKALVITDDAARYENWKDGVTGGTGFDAWVLRSGPHAGFFVGSSTRNTGIGNIDTSGKAWGLFANSGDTASAWRRFSAGALAVGTERFDIDFDHGKVGANGPSVGLGLQNAASNTLWEFYLAGGSANYVLRDADGERDSGIRRSTEALHISFRLTSSKQYAADIAAGFSMKNFKGRLISDTDPDVVQVYVWNFNAGEGSAHDTYVNRMVILPTDNR